MEVVSNRIWHNLFCLYFVYGAMKYFGLLYSMFLLFLIVSCGSDGGSGTIPDIPDEPEGTKSSLLLRDGQPLSLDGSSNLVSLDPDGRLTGENLFLAPAFRCNGISYVNAISGFSWGVKSDVLRGGYGMVMGSKLSDGAQFTRLYVVDVDSADGGVELKYQSPFYGSADKFYLNHKGGLGLYKDAGDTTVVIIKPTTYNVELASGEWIKAVPHITYVRLEYKENKTRNFRTDTLIFSNGVVDDLRLPILQSWYSPSDSITLLND